MTVYYCDSSILIKRHIDETGSHWFRQLVEQPDVALFTAQISIVEMGSAFNRRLREKFISAEEYRDVMAQAQFLFSASYNVLQLSDQVVQLACAVLERHPLRAFDAIHLATSLTVNERLLSLNAPALTFLSADHRLLVAAAAEGLATFDPATAP